MKKYWLAWFFGLSFWTAFGQQPGLAGMLSELESATTDTARMHLSFELSRRYFFNNPDSSLLFSRMCLSLAQQSGDKIYCARCNNLQASLFNTLARYEEAKPLIDAGLACAVESGDSIVLCRLWQTVGQYHKNQNHYDSAMVYYVRAHDLAERLHSERDVVNVLWLMSTIYGLQEDYPNVVRITKDLIRRAEQTGMKEKVAQTLNSLSSAYANLDQLDSAEYYIREAIAYQEKNGSDYNILGTSYYSWAAIAQKMQQPERSLELGLKALEILGKMGDSTRTTFLVLQQIGELHLQQKRYSQAIPCLETAMGGLQKFNILPACQQTAQNLAQAYEATGNYPKALFWWKKSTEFQDSINRAHHSREVETLKTQFETRAKETAIQNLQTQASVQRQNILLLSLGLVILFLFVGALFWFNRRLQAQKQRTEQALADLKSTQRQLLQAGKMASLGQLTAGIAHELNNPLNFIANAAEALQIDLEEAQEVLKSVEEETPIAAAERLQNFKNQIDLPLLRAEITNLLGSILRGAERAKSIVQGLRTFSYAGQGERQPHDVHQELDNALLLLESEWRGVCKLEKQYDAAPSAILADPGRPGQVFVNVLANAIHAIGRKFPGSPEAGRLRISTRFEQGAVLIEIADNGTGMDAQTKERLFEPFFTTKDVGDGVGLGLSVSYAIVDQHGGVIDVESAPGEGATFTIRWPVAAAQHS